MDSAGHTLLTDGRSAGGMTKLFVSHPGNAFSSTTFCHFWRSLMEQVTEQKYFAPSVLRTMFVEEYTAAHGAEPEMWDGCAAIMGNSVPQWHNPSACEAPRGGICHPWTHGAKGETKARYCGRYHILVALLCLQYFFECGYLCYVLLTLQNTCKTQATRRVPFRTYLFRNYCL